MIWIHHKAAIIIVKNYYEHRGCKGERFACLVSATLMGETTMPHIDDLGSCIELIGSGNTPEEAFAHFCKILEYSGYDRVTYSLVTDHPSLNLPKRHGLATSYPEDWMTFYREHGYMKIDPVVHEVLTSKRPFYWDDLVAKDDLPEESLRLMNEAAEAGLNSGVAFSLAGMAGELVGIGMARSKGARRKKTMTFLPKRIC